MWPASICICRLVDGLTLPHCLLTLDTATQHLKPYILCERMAARSGGSLPFHSSNICSNFSMGPQPLGPMVQGLSTISNTCFLLYCRLIVWLFDCCMIWWFYCLLDWLFWLCGPGALGAPGPKLEDMRGECKYLLSDDYLLSGKQRQSGMHPTAP